MNQPLPPPQPSAPVATDREPGTTSKRDKIILVVLAIAAAIGLGVYSLVTAEADESDEPKSEWQTYYDRTVDYFLANVRADDSPTASSVDDAATVIADGCVLGGWELAAQYATTAEIAEAGGDERLTEVYWRVCPQALRDAGLRR